MTRVYFVRHAQPDPSGGFNPEFPLTEQGARDALLVRDILIDKGLDAVWSSSYLRAVQTVAPLADALGLEIHKDFRLHERTAGNWKGSYPDYASFIAKQIGDYSSKAEGGESMEEVSERCVGAMSEILAENDGKTIAVGIHGMALASLLKHWFPGFGLRDFEQMVDLMPLVLRLDIENDTCADYGIELAVRRAYPDSYLQFRDAWSRK